MLRVWAASWAAGPGSGDQLPSESLLSDSEGILGYLALNKLAYRRTARSKSKRL
jgi:hypothetical protein